MRADPAARTPRLFQSGAWELPAQGRVARIAAHGVRLLAIALLALAASNLPRERPGILVQFFLLAVVARALRVPFGRGTLDLEAAAIFPLVLLTGSWPSGVVLAAAAPLAHLLVERRGRLSRDDWDELVHLVIAYAASSFFSVSLGRVAGGSGLLSALTYVGTLLVFFFASVVLAALRAVTRRDTTASSLVRTAIYQFVALLLLSPIVALVVMLHPTYGMGGVVLAFTSVALVSASLRNLARARSRTAELSRQNRELGTLREIWMIFSSATRDDELYAKLYQTFRSVLPVRALAIATYEQEGPPTVLLEGEVSLSRRAFLAWVESHRDVEARFVTAGGPRTAIGPDRDLVLSGALAYQVRVPLQTPERATGLLVLESDDGALLEPEVLQQTTVLADHVALSLQDRGLRRQMEAVNERLKGRTEVLTRILDVSGELKSHLTTEHVLASIVRTVGSLGWGSVLLSLYDRLEGVFEHRAQLGLDANWEELSRKRIPREEISRWFTDRWRISKSYFVPAEASIEGAGPLERESLSGLPRPWRPLDRLYVPLTTGDRLLGVLTLDQPKNQIVAGLEDVQALEIFANQAVTAIQSARAYETTRQMSVKDSLTAAYNHRHFQEALYREITRAERTGQPVALVMVDIDDFKKINDRWGHPVGDVVLKGLVEEMLRSVREMDTVARYGGEEFAIILPETPPEKALLVAERMRARVAARPFVTPEVSHPIGVSISLGVASFPEDAGSKRLLIEKADQALYRAKRSGKNMVVRATPEDVPPEPAEAPPAGGSPRGPDPDLRPSGETPAS